MLLIDPFPDLPRIGICWRCTNHDGLDRRDRYTRKNWVSEATAWLVFIKKKTG